MDFERVRKSVIEASHPVMDCETAEAYESTHLDSEDKVWKAMQRVGHSLGRGILREFGLSRFESTELKLLGLIGKGHNGGDALLGIREIASRARVARVAVVLASPRSELKPNTERALSELESICPLDCIHILDLNKESIDEVDLSVFDICVDGLVGMQFRPPLRGVSRSLVNAINETDGLRMRVAVDLPSGLCDRVDEPCFRADVTFATGILKCPLTCFHGRQEIGRIRYLDIGFFDKFVESETRVLTDDVLNPLRGFRPASGDKRTHGHLLIVAGSRNMPGALLMSIGAALQSGAGLVTVCAPKGVVASLSPFAPEAMWIPMPEDDFGGFDGSGLDAMGPLLDKASAVLVGPGMGDGEGAIQLASGLAATIGCPIVLDADALRSEVIGAVKGGCIATPHLGEFRRISGKDANENLDEAVREYSLGKSIVVALKGSVTRVSAGSHVYLNTTGNAVLSRGGSGDMLAGVMAGLLAQSPRDPLGAACRAVYWHGKAADLLAYRNGQVAVRSTDLLGCFSDALLSEVEDRDDA